MTILTTERDQAQAKATERATEIERQATLIERERQAGQAARIELTKAELRLESLPRLEQELERLRSDLVVSQQAKVDAEKEAAVAVARLADAERRAIQAESREQLADKRAADVAAELAKLRSRMADRKAAAAKEAPQTVPEQSSTTQPVIPKKSNTRQPIHEPIVIRLKDKESAETR